MKLSTAVKTVSLILGIAFSVFAVSLVVFAATTWVGPPGPPPECPLNTSGCDTPIHTGTASQVKRGNLGIGIGMTAPNSTLSVLSAPNIAPSLAYRSGALFGLDQGTVELAGGTNTTSPWAFWLQTRTSSNTAWPLVLNPLGGNVGIGTANPGTARLKIEGGC